MIRSKPIYIEISRNNNFKISQKRTEVESTKIITIHSKILNTIKTNTNPLQMNEIPYMLLSDPIKMNKDNEKQRIILEPEKKKKSNSRNQTIKSSMAVLFH